MQARYSKKAPSRYSLQKPEEDENANEDQYKIDFLNNHEVIRAIGEHLAKIPGLQSSGNKAQKYIINPVNASGLPHAARGFIQ